jgi:hypothetical protein
VYEKAVPDLFDRGTPQMPDQIQMGRALSLKRDHFHILEVEAKCGHPDCLDDQLPGGAPVAQPHLQCRGCCVSCLDPAQRAPAGVDVEEKLHVSVVPVRERACQQFAANSKERFAKSEVKVSLRPGFVPHEKVQKLQQAPQRGTTEEGRVRSKQSFNDTRQQKLTAKVTQTVFDFKRASLVVVEEEKRTPPERHHVRRFCTCACWCCRLRRTYQGTQDVEEFQE